MELEELIRDTIEMLQGNCDVYNDYYLHSTNKYEANKYKTLLTNERLKKRTLEEIIWKYEGRNEQ